MILFYEDWEKYPNAIPDLNTRNEYFLRYAGLLKAMGIKNHSWCLQLHNPSLSGVDPRDPNLTDEQKEDILDEIAINPMYFFREVVMIEAKGSPEPVQFQANRGNMSLFWLFFNNIMTMLLQIRQTGKSLTSDLLYLGLLSFWTVNANITVITKDNTLRSENVERIKALYQQLPDYIQLQGANDTMNSEAITFNSLGNKLRILLAQKSKLAALNLGRGLTGTINGFDEFAFLYNNEITIPAALAAGGNARNEARKSGQPYGTIFYTTAGYLDTEPGKYAHRFYTSAMRWTETLLDLKDKEELHSVVAKHATGPADVVLVEMNHRQLGKTDEWLARTIRESAQEGVRVEAEFFNRWSSGSQSSAISAKLIKMLREHEREPDFTEISPLGYMLKWYKPRSIAERYLNKPIIIGLDTSNALGGDETSLIAKDLVTGEVLFTGTYNRTNLGEFSAFLFWILQKYTRAVLIPEHKSSATVILDNLALMFIDNNMNIFTRIYNTIIQNGGIEPNKLKDVTNGRGSDITKEYYVKYKKYFGFTTSSGGITSRTGLYDMLEEMVELTGNKFRDMDLISQTVKLEVKNNRIDHASGEHDDLVIANLLTWWFLKSAKNVQYYGLNRAIFLTAVTPPATTNDELKNREIAKRRQELIMEIDDILTRIRDTDNLLMRNKLLVKLRLTELKLDKETLASLDIDSKLREILDTVKKDKPYNQASLQLGNRLVA